MLTELLEIELFLTFKLHFMLNRIVRNRTVYVYKMDLVLNNLQWLIYYKTKPKPNQIKQYFLLLNDHQLKYWERSSPLNFDDLAETNGLFILRTATSLGEGKSEFKRTVFYLVGNPHGVMVKVLSSGLEASGFKFQLRYGTHLRTNTLRKYIEPSYPPHVRVKSYHCLLQKWIWHWIILESWYVLK